LEICAWSARETLVSDEKLLPVCELALENMTVLDEAYCG
jgi:hypothetical protein